MFADPHTLTGMAAGVATSVLFMLTSMFFTAAGRRLGSTVVNAIRIFLAIGFLAVTHRVLAGVWMPTAEGRQVAFLAVSGVIGLAIGDQALFTAFVLIGPRLSTLCMTTSPLFAVAFGWLVLGEVLYPIAWLGVGLTLLGVGWVVLERQPGQQKTPAHLVRGLCLAFVGAACQAGGLLLSKQGMGHGWLPPSEHLSPHAATLIRMVFAAGAMVPAVLFRLRQLRRQDQIASTLRTNDARGVWSGGLLYTGLGAIVGPFLGVWMSLIASDRVSLGIAQTLCSLTPIFILPAVALIYKERISVRAAIGAAMAVGGAALLFVRPG